MTLAGRVSTSTGPRASRTSSRWVRNWSRLETSRMAFFRLLCPTWTTAPICWPSPSKTAYSLVSSISLVFWVTTRTGCSYSDGPPDAPRPRTGGAGRVPTAAGGRRWWHGGGRRGGSAAGRGRSSPGRPTSGLPRYRPDRDTSPAGAAAASRRSSYRPEAPRGRLAACQTPAMADVPPSSLVGFEAWAQLAGDSATSRTEWAAVVAAWSEPHRRYHDLAHLAAVLGIVGALAARPTPTPSGWPPGTTTSPTSRSAATTRR